MRHLWLRSAAPDSVIALWECGLVSIRSRGEPEWISMHGDGTAGFDEITADTVWIRGQSGDPARDQRRGYRLTDGAVLGAASS